MYCDNKYDNNCILDQKLIKYSAAFSTELLQLVVAPTLNCNFSCLYCYEKGLKNNKMSSQTENNLINFIKSYNKDTILDLTWYGGEPLLAFNTIKNILAKLRENNIRLGSHALITNGYLLTKEVSYFFKDYKLDNVQITIDGTKEKHDKLRKHKSGSSTFDTILENIDLFTDIVPQTSVTIRVNVSNENKDDFPEIYKYLNNRYKNKRCIVSPALVKDHGNCEVHCIKNKDKITFLKDLYFKYGIKEVEFFPKILQSGVCTADKLHAFVVDPLGNLYKCWVDIGKKEKVVSQLENTKITNFNLISRYVINTDKFQDEKCLKCFLFPVCDGGCGLYRMNYQLNDTYYDVCPINRDEMDILLEAYYELQHK